MTTHIRIPPLAGLATYDQAARIGHSVNENVERLVRFAWIERRLLHTLAAFIPSTPEWEVKGAFALHQWLCALHVDSLRTRISEMRSPAPPMDRAPDAGLDRALDELLAPSDTIELLAGIYSTALPALRDAYRRHLTAANPVADHPTCRVLQLALSDLDTAIAWGEAALGAVALQPEDVDRARAFAAHVAAHLAAVGGMDGSAPVATPAPPSRRAAGAPSMRPRRDERLTGAYNFRFPPHELYADRSIPADERNLALLCKRTLEMDVPEMIASIITERADQPWEFYYDYSRQLWDEARHAMLGTVALTARGVDWTSLPLNVGFSLRLNLHAEPLERQILLYAIEQSLMPADVGKRYEYETAGAAGDDLSSHFHDYDWADEVLHAQIGRRALRREKLTAAEATARAQQIHESTWQALEGYAHLDEQDSTWWDKLVRRTFGRPSAWRDTADSAPPRVLAE